MGGGRADRHRRSRRTRPAGRSRSTPSAPRPRSWLLDAFEAAIGPTGPNPLHHRIEHNIQVTDAQLARMVAMHLPMVIHLDTAVPTGWADRTPWPRWPRRPARVAWLTRWRDFVDAGLHVAAATDMPWILPDFKLTDDIGRPVDQIAGGMDPIGRVNPEPPAWMARSAADRRAGPAGSDRRRSVRAGGRDAARASGAGHARRRHDPER